MQYNIMRILASFLLGLLISVACPAQLTNGSIGADFTVTDQFGNSQNLYTYLNQGYSVIMVVDATWNGPGWGYHTSGALEELYALHGPAGAPGVLPNTTDDVMVFWVETDATTTDADLAGTGGATQGNWLNPSGSPIQYPMANPTTVLADQINEDYQIAYFPTIYRICAGRLVTEVGQEDANNLYDTLGECPPPAFTNNDPAIVQYMGADGACDDLDISILLQNYGLQPLTSCTFQIQLGSESSQYTWSGFLNTYEIATVDLGSLPMSETEVLTVTIISSDGNTANNSISQTISYAGNSTQTLRLDIEFDNWPEEFSWEIYNEADQVIAAEAYSAANADGSSITEFIDLPSLGCYRFVAYDAYGDGLNGSIWGATDGSVLLRSFTSGNAVYSTIWNYPGDYGFYEEAVLFKAIVTSANELGCTNPQACNFSSSATIDDGSCLYVGMACNDGNSNTFSDEIQANCLCQGYFVTGGCTDMTACNYDPAAEFDNGSCFYPGTPCNDGNSSTFGDVYQENCVCAGYTNCNPFGYNFTQPSEYVYPAEGAAINDGCVGEIYTQTIYFLLPTDVGALDPAYSGVPIQGYQINSLSIDGASAANYGFAFDCDISSCAFGAGEQHCITIYGVPNQGGNFVLTVDLMVYASLAGFPVELPFSAGNYTLEVASSCSQAISGCTNPAACNYNPLATINNGTCILPGSPCDDNNTSTINDAIQTDCSCSGESIDPGCLGFSVNNITILPQCAGDASGSITLQVTGTTAPYIYEWSNGQGTSLISGLVAGSYVVLITDATGCAETLTFNLTDPIGMELQAAVAQPSCGNSADGAVEVFVTQGTPPFNYAWSNGVSESAMTELIAGVYSVVVTDALGCSETLAVELVSGSEFSVDILGPFVADPFAVSLYSLPSVTGAAYSWNVNGGNILSGQGTNFIEVQWGSDFNGSVEVVVELPDGCVYTDALVVEVGLWTEDAGDRTKILEVYPNPFRQEIVLNMTGSSRSTVQYRLYEVTGKLVLSGFSSGIQHVIATDNLPSSSYILEVITEDHVNRLRLVKN